MTRMTPTSWGANGGREIRLLGSLRAVLDAMPIDGTLIVRNMASGTEAFDLWRAIGRGTPLKFVVASAGPAGLYELAPETVIGVAPDAWHGILSPMWAEMQAILNSRFKTVHWG